MSLSNQMWNSWLSRLNYAWSLLGVPLCWKLKTVFENNVDYNSEMFDEMATYIYCVYILPMNRICKKYNKTESKRILF